MFGRLVGWSGKKCQMVVKKCQKVVKNVKKCIEMSKKLSKDGREMLAIKKGQKCQIKSQIGKMEFED